MGLLLAAGASRRMGGRNKLLEPLGDDPLIRVQTLRLKAAAPCAVVVLRPGDDAARAALDGLDVRMLVAPEAEEGLSGSLRAGIAALADAGARRALVTLADLVALDAPDLVQIAKAGKTAPSDQILRGATQDGTPGHPILFPRDLFPDLMRLSGDTGARDLLKAHQGRTTLIALPGERALLDLDTPEDWDRWRSG